LFTSVAVPMLWKFRMTRHMFIYIKSDFIDEITSAVLPIWHSLVFASVNVVPSVMSLPNWSPRIMRKRNHRPYLGPKIFWLHPSH
jgi:hypothetical protein